MFAPVLCLLPTLNVYSFPCLSCSLVSTFFYCLTHSLSSIPPPSLTAHASGNNNVWLIYLDVRVFPNVPECSRLIWRGLNRTGCFVVLVTERKWILFLRGIFMRVLIGGWAGDHSLTRLVGILWIGRIKKSIELFTECWLIGYLISPIYPWRPLWAMYFFSHVVLVERVPFRGRAEPSVPILYNERAKPVRIGAEKETDPELKLFATRVEVDQFFFVYVPNQCHCRRPFPSCKQPH